jgi:hypothetical protein
MGLKFILSSIVIGISVMLLLGWHNEIWIKPIPFRDQHKQDSSKSKDFFGMRMRKASSKISNIYEPVVIKKAPGNESTILRLENHTLKIFFINRPGPANKLMSISSLDDGITWEEPEKEIDLPDVAYYANNLVQDEKGNLHCIFHIFSEGENGYRGRHLNLWYCRTRNNSKDWLKPKKIFDGYVGSIRGFIELKNKRLLLVVARAVPSRVEKPESNLTDYGWNEIVSFYSDDKGKTWKTSENSIKIPVESNKKTRYGGVEPSILELKDGKIWMLIRTNKGCLYQSFSDDGGATWRRAEPTKFISSDSPASILRLSDNRVVVLWCSDQRWDDPSSYANGGREVLHAAISSDEGKTWKGFREILTSPLMDSAVKGDRGTAYSSAIETSKDKILLVSGQGEGKSVVMFDPDWLEQKMAYDNFSEGLVQWTLFGADNLTGLEHFGSGNKSKALLICKSDNKKDQDTEGIWNFPMTAKGKLIIEISMNPNNKGISLALTDHFSVCNDTKASLEAPVYFLLNENIIGANRSFIKRIEINWDTYQKNVSILLDGKLKEEKHFRKEVPFGLNYLRIGIPGASPDRAGYYIKSVKLVPQN